MLVCCASNISFFPAAFTPFLLLFAAMSGLRHTSVTEIPKLIANCRKAFRSNKLRTAQSRKAAIRSLVSLVDENQRDLNDAVWQDLRKSMFEFNVMEVAMIKNEAWEAISHLDSWMQPQKVSTELAMKLEYCATVRDPLGVVLIIGAWNYPLQLLFVGLVGALAAGNSVVLKPSEIAPATAAAIAALVPKYFDPDIVCVVNGGVEETTSLLQERFDHILYTGNSRVARIVMSAAAKHLTPVTLELGGKSPCVVDKDCDIRIAARRIAWGKVANAGQTCIAPDYLLVHPSVKDKLVEELAIAFTNFLGKDAKSSPDYGRIVSDAHFDRIKSLMTGGTVVVGGATDKATRFIEPTVLDKINLQSPLMNEEIFGPLLPIIPCATIDEAISFINDREKPLALYVFSNNSANVDRLTAATSAGGVTVNDCLMHAGVSTLPFGGVGESGMGAYHGKLTFEMFSHKKALMKRKLAMEFLNDMRYPPYTSAKFNRMKFLLFKNGPEKRFLPAFVGCFLLLALCLVFLTR